MTRTRRSARRTAATVLAVSLLLVGCASGSGDLDAPADGDEGSTGTTSDPQDDAAADGGASGTALTGFDAQLRLAIEDAAVTAGVAVDAVALVEGGGVTWRDGSLGCPEPDMMYTQALVEGYRFVLEVAGERVTYHGATGQDPFRCDDPAEDGAVG